MAPVVSKRHGVIFEALGKGESFAVGQCSSSSCHCPMASPLSACLHSNGVGTVVVGLHSWSASSPASRGAQLPGDAAAQSRPGAASSMAGEPSVRVAHPASVATLPCGAAA